MIKTVKYLIIRAFMRKLSLLFLIFMLSFSIFAQDTSKMALGLGPEWNMNSRENFAAGLTLSFDYNLASPFSVGVNVTASSNFNGITVLEPAVSFRWYFSGRNHTGWFIQADAGVYLVLEENDVIPLFLGGLRGGIRIPMGRIFIEPFGRIGYPFFFGIGALAGMRF